MAFSDFQYPDVLAKFDLKYEPVTDLFSGVPPVVASESFRQSLAVGTRLATILSTEKARSEWMIAPILGEMWGRYAGRIGLYSGVEFQADPSAQLTGYCDFLMCRGPQQITVSPPTLLVFEAKRDNINQGLGQCVAAMVGAQRFNARHGADEDRIVGCVTTGSLWRFLELRGQALRLDLTEYSIQQLDRLMGNIASVLETRRA